MFLSLGVVVGQWAVTFLLGWGLLGLVSPVWRDRLGMASPVIGMAAWIVGMYALIMVVPARLGAPVLLLLSIGIAAWRLIATASARPPGTDTLRGARATTKEFFNTAVRASALASAGLLGFGIASMPSIEARTATVMTTANHDALFYISASEWAIDHTVWTNPSFGAGPADSVDGPANAPALQTSDRELRIGDVLVVASTSTLTGIRAHEFWTIQIGSWLLYAPGSVLVAALCLGRRERRATTMAAFGGLVLSSSTLVFWQLYNQNSASVLGIVLMPMALGAVFTWIDDTEERYPLGLAAMSFAAALGTYSEYTSTVVFGLIVAIAARRPSRLLPSLGRSVVFGVVALAMAPLVWWRLVHALLFTASVDSGAFPSQYRHLTTELLLGKLTGAAWPSEGVVSLTATMLIGAIIVVGLAAALVMQRARFLWIGLAMGTAATLWYIMSVAENDYSHQRAIEIVQPLGLMVAVMGWLDLGRRLFSRAGNTLQSAPAALAAIVIAGAATASAGRYLPKTEFLDMRAVDNSYDEMSEWAHRYGGPDGADLTMVLAGYEETLWGTDAVRDLPDVSYPVLYPDYTLRTSFPDPSIDHYVIIDRTVIMLVEPGDPLEINDRFALYDASAGSFTAAVPRRFGFLRTESVYGPVVWLAQPGTLVIVRNDAAPAAVEFRVAALPQLAPLDVTFEWPQPGSDEPLVETQTLGADTSIVTIETTGLITPILVTPARAPEFPVSGSDDRRLAVKVEPLVAAGN